MLGNDADHLAEGCAQQPQSVVCIPLPAIDPGDLGPTAVPLWFADGPAVVAWDRHYGDVVLARFGAVPPFKPMPRLALAGVPIDAPVVGDPSGPRGGVAEPGSDVGRVVDATVDAAGSLHVAFRDDSGDSLRYLRVLADGVVEGRHVVASGDGIGASIAIGVTFDGAPVVATFSPADPVAGGLARLRLYAAKTAAVASAAQWSVVPVASVPVAAVPPPCGGGCPVGAACVVGPGAGAGTGGDACVTPAAGCVGCLPAQVCAAGGVCRSLRLPPAPLARLPAGPGGFLSLATRGASVALAAGDAHAGSLVVYRGPRSGPLTATAVDQAKTLGAQSDISHFPAVAIDTKGALWLLGQEARRGQVFLAHLPVEAAAWQISVLDDGMRDDGPHRVGADCHLLLGADGPALAVWQDTRAGRTVYARLDPDGKVVERAEFEPPSGIGGFSGGAVDVSTTAATLMSSYLTPGTATRPRAAIDLQRVVWGGE